MKKRFAAVGEAVKAKPAAVQVHAYLSFLASVPDDPEDCVTTDVNNAISRAERNLIWLEVAGHRYAPDKVFHCNEIEGPSKLCRGVVLDDTPLIPETELLKKRPTLPTSGQARLKVLEAAHMKVIGLFAGDAGELQDGKPPAEIPMKDHMFSLADLSQQPHSVVIGILQGDDALHFRKCVWLF